MDAVPVPSQAIGYVGMVAMLCRVGPETDGRLVAIRLPVGHISSLSDHGGPTFAWQVLVLGAPIDLDGKLSRQIVVADRCLKPVSRIEPAEVDRLARVRAQEEFDEALDALAAVIARHPMTEDDLERQIERAAEQFSIQHALEKVPMPVVLKELNFRPSTTDSSNLWHWSGAHQGVELYVTASQDMFDTWTILGRSKTTRQLMWDESRVLSEEPRGKIALRVLQLWRIAFGNAASVPESLSLGLTYEQHLQDLQSVNLALPTLDVDGEILRATRRWIMQRHLPSSELVGPPVDQIMALRYSDGLLRLEVAGAAYACPARGIWLSDQTLSLHDFLAVPFWMLRGRTVALVQCADRLLLSGQAVSLRSLDLGPQA